MSDYIALSIIRGSVEAGSALPGAPVVDDGLGSRPVRRSVRRSLATTLRSAATVERRLADRLDPAPACRPASARA
jgi:hypothetical protein